MKPNPYIEQIGVETAINRLIAWAECEELRADSLGWSEGNAHVNRAANYRIIAESIRAAKAKGEVK